MLFNAKMRLLAENLRDSSVRFGILDELLCHLALLFLHEFQGNNQDEKNHGCNHSCSSAGVNCLY